MSGTSGGPRQEALQQGAANPYTPIGGNSGNQPTVPNFVLGLLVLLTASVLPAAGAFVAAAVNLPVGTKRVTMWVTYTRAAGVAACYPVFRASARASTAASYYRVGILNMGSFLATTPNGAVNFYQEELLGPAPATDAAIRYELTFLMPANAVQFQLEIAERGAVGTPGTVSVSWTGDG
jgi:hypothetical protein